MIETIYRGHGFFKAQDGEGNTSYYFERPPTDRSIKSSMTEEEIHTMAEEQLELARTFAFNSLLKQDPRPPESFIATIENPQVRLRAMDLLLSTNVLPALIYQVGD